MDTIEAVKSRRSIRGYKPNPVPMEVIREVLEIAGRSPSAMNTQPWEVTVIAGQVLEDIKRGFTEMLDAKVQPNPDFPVKLYEGVYRERQVDLAKAIFELMGIEREDKKKRAEWMRKGFRFFDAPAAIIISIDQFFDDVPVGLFDLGAFAQTICLVALDYGLGTCLERQGVMYPDVVRRYTGIPESKRIIISIAIGYPDWDFPANTLETEREPVGGFVAWCGWE